MLFTVLWLRGLHTTCGNIVRCVFSVSEYPFHIGPLPRNQFVIYKRAAMQYIACCRHLCILLAFCSSSKSGADNTATSPQPLYQHQSPKTVCQSVCQHLILRSTGYTFLPINHLTVSGSK